MRKTTDDITAKYLLELLDQISANLTDFGFKPQAMTLQRVRQEISEIIATRCNEAISSHVPSED